MMVKKDLKKQYWLMKSEPDAYSIDDLRKEKRTMWDGVRNYQARNFMRDDMKVGDVAFFYHSNTKEPGIVGVARVCSKPYADPTAFDPTDSHYDKKSKKDSPTWFLVDVCFVAKLPKMLSLDAIKSDATLKDMLVARRGNRLSITPVEEKHATKILKKLS